MTEQVCLSVVIVWSCGCLGTHRRECNCSTVARSLSLRLLSSPAGFDPLLSLATPLIPWLCAHGSVARRHGWKKDLNTFSEIRHLNIHMDARSIWWNGQTRFHVIIYTTLSTMKFNSILVVNYLIVSFRPTFMHWRQSSLLMDLLRSVCM